MSGKSKIVLAVFMLWLLTGCSTGGSNMPLSNESVEAANAVWYEDYDKQDTGVLTELDEKKETVTIKKIDSGEKLVLNYTGGTKVTDKYESVLSIKQVEPGELVDICYRESDSSLRVMTVSADAWEYTGVENLTYDRTQKVMDISGMKYKYGDSFTLISDGKEIDLLELNPIDVVTVKGYNKKICSVIVTRGHGYIKLKNDDFFIGGWIDVGQESARPITKDMLVVASEGSHNVTVANEGAGGTKSISVKRNEETVMDVGDLKGETPKSGSLKFKVKPAGAKLFIDGVETDYKEVVVLEYGSYRIVVKSTNYDDFSQTIVVGASYAEIEIDMTNSSDSDTKKNSGNSTNNNNSNNNTNYNNNTNNNSNNNTNYNNPNNNNNYNNNFNNNLNNSNNNTNNNNNTGNNSGTSSDSGKKDEDEGKEVTEELEIVTPTNEICNQE